MEIQTVADLKEYLTANKMSPERFGKITKISNMTIRRLLRKSPATPIPGKYLLSFNQQVNGNTTANAAHRSTLAGLAASLMGHQQPKSESDKQDFSPLLEELEQTGRDVSDLGKLENDVATKLDDNRIDKSVRGKIKTLIGAIRSHHLNARQKAVCIGALLYLINPLDLIPDTLPVIGYLDDFAIISLVVGDLTFAPKSKTSDATSPEEISSS